MLDASPADTVNVIHRVLVLAACVTSALVVASFGLFARDQLAGASQHQVAEINTSQPTTPGVTAQGPHRGQPRRFIDGAASTLTSPFKSIVASDNQWVTHGIPTILALLAYGVGIGFVARYTRGMS
jgi:hypothetical protein